MSGKMTAVSSKHHNIERIVARAQVLPVGKCNPQPEHSDFSLRSQIPEPGLRTQPRGRVGDLAAVQERTQLDANQRVVVDVLVEFPVGEEIVTSQRGAAFAAITNPDVRPQPEVVVALRTAPAPRR